MAYIVNQDIIDRVGTSRAAQLTTDSGTTPSQAVLDEVRGGAEGEANGYLARRYAVPVDLTAHADLAGTLKTFVLDIAVYRLHLRRPPAPDHAAQSRKEAVEWLKLVAKGEIVLPAAVTPAATTSDYPVAEWGSMTQDHPEV
jgi:phage gp36-like protein